jgi:hypothetical protein
MRPTRVERDLSLYPLAWPRRPSSAGRVSARKAEERPRTMASLTRKQMPLAKPSEPCSVSGCTTVVRKSEFYGWTMGELGSNIFCRTPQHRHLLLHLRRLICGSQRLRGREGAVRELIAESFLHRQPRPRRMPFIMFDWVKQRLENIK